ncbi:MAG TPA: Mu transposase C-terminal domain-containing protein [Kineosporiaceae bacterium]
MNQQALARWQVLRPHLDDGVALVRAAQEAGVSPRTAQRWLARYRESGLAGLARAERADSGRRSFPDELVALIEGLALTPPRSSVATITRQVAPVAAARGWPVPSYSSVYAITSRLHPHLQTLAHDGSQAFRDRYELVYRRQAERPNQIWQADHTQLDILILDSSNKPARPWLTVVLDDCSRAVAGYTAFLGAPSALNLSLALRQAIWRKTDPTWAVHGLPDVLYVDHGSDFTSDHITAVAADLHIHLVHSAVARPQGRGKVERFMGTVTTSLLPHLPGYLTPGHRRPHARLTLPEFDATLAAWITQTYHQQPHSETGVPPQQAWLADGWLPRTPDSLEALDLLLVMVAKPRVVHRDGIRFQGLRYLDPTLAAYVGEPVTIRYDPRDLGEIRVFHRNQFLCRAISPDYAGTQITLKDIQAARTAHRRALRARLTDRRSTVAEYLPRHPATADPSAGAPPNRAPTPPESTLTSGPAKLYVYLEDRPGHRDADGGDDSDDEPPQAGP